MGKHMRRLVMEDVKTSLLLGIVKKENLWKMIQFLKQNTKCQKYLVLKTALEEYEDFFFVIFESNNPQLRNDKFKFTVIHKKGRCYYTINALNSVIYQENHGILDKEYLIDWELFQNMILFLNKEKELIKLPTKLHRIIKQ